jgi:hypothetical protein
MKSLIKTTVVALAATLCFGQFAMAQAAEKDLKFVRGFPTKETAQMLHDELDYQRAVQVYLRHIPAMSMYGFRRGIDEDLSGKPAQPQKVALWENLLDAKTLLLTGNTEVLYSMTYLNLKEDGPTVIEAPPGVLGILDDMWMRYVTDVGLGGADKGKGGKYLILPPDYKGDVPKGYYAERSTTYGVWVALRGFVVDGKTEKSAANLRTMKIYPLSKKDDPPAMDFVNATGKRVNTLMTEDYGYFEELAKLINEEYEKSITAQEYGMLASIGIIKGKPFKPDARMKKILERAASTGVAMAKTLFLANRDPHQFIYPGRQWRTGWIGGDYTYMVGNYLYQDAQIYFNWMATGNTPAMVKKVVGKGSQYLVASSDADGDPLDGGQLYKLTIGANVPAKQFWSLIAYDIDSRSLLIRDDIPAGKDFPSISSYRQLKKNSDGSVDLYLGPKAPEGYEKNFIRTVPGKGYFVIYRLYGALEPYFDQSWKLNDLVKLK